MQGLFWRQFTILFWKNWIVLFKHSLLNTVRCFFLPVGYGIFLAVAQIFLSKPSNFGIGEPVTIHPLEQTFDPSLALVWADGTNGTYSPSAQSIMTHVTRDFTPSQLAAVRRMDSPEEIVSQCPQNFNLFSQCFAGIAFNSLPEFGPINYTILADGGLYHVDVEKHTSDFELRILPLQWAIDRAIIELRTGQKLQTPVEWPFTRVTNEQQDTDIRLSYIRGLRTLLVLALFICYVGISYQLPGAVASERANLITTHMKSMGLVDSARVISWHLSMSLAYLPAWIIVALIWRHRIFSGTNVGVVLIVHILLGLQLASWSFFVAAPFGKSPQLAAVVSTFLAIVFAIIALVMSGSSNGVAFVFSILFPPGYYIFAIRAICGFENHIVPTMLLKGDPDNGLILLPLLIAAIIDIFLWPWLGLLVERRLYDARNPRPRRRRFLGGPLDPMQPLEPDIAISMKNLGKTFKASTLRPSRNTVTAIEDLTLDIPKFGIFVLLGSNGAGKSTVLSILGGLAGRTSGTVQFETGGDHAEPGTLGIVPQRNVLFPDLTCYQTLRVWRTIKQSRHSAKDEDIVQLLKDCDLGNKVHANAATLSGGQKRKLQLAIGLVGGSKIVLVDECTSGVDPLSRRALWRILTSCRQDRTIIYTTHFLDEADLLADNIAILATPGRLVAQGSPVSLKHDLGDGYTVHATLRHGIDEGVEISAADILDRIRKITPDASVDIPDNSHARFHLKSKDAVQVEQVLQTFDDMVRESLVISYDILGTSIENIFLELMAKHDSEKLDSEKGSASTSMASPSRLELSAGQPRTVWQQPQTIFFKRRLVARRSWLTPLLSVLVAVLGSTIPLVFLSGRQPSCDRRFRTSELLPLYLPISPISLSAGVLNGSAQVLNTPPGLIHSTFGDSVSSVFVADVTDNSTFVDTIREDYRSLPFGGLSMDFDAETTMLAWEASAPGYTGLVLLNLASNILYKRAQDTSDIASPPAALIQANYELFPLVAAGTLVALKWVAFFGASMAVYTAFYALYVSKERRSSVQAMQFSNGLSDPIGLWLGHLSFDVLFTVISESVVVVVFATVSDQFHGLGLFWVVLVLYGVAGTLFSYCISLFVSSPLAAFATVAGYQIIIFALYLAAYLLTLTYAKTSDADSIITIIHFTISILSPVTSVLRAAFVSVNLFSLLCTDNDTVSTAETGTILRLGGPIVYLIFHSFVLLAILIWVDSGAILPRKKSSRQTNSVSGHEEKEDIAEEAHRAVASDDVLRVIGISKSYDKNVVVDNVSISASTDTIFALLGPNGAGKTTAFNIVRGDVVPDVGDVTVAGESVIRHPKKARLVLGVCPQFTAIDAQLTVREHLEIYGRLKGLGKSALLRHNVQSLLDATGLAEYGDRLASKLSGGNQRKLSLAIALIGDPAVVLIDEFSTGVDARKKREMWTILKNVAVGKALMITTHSMEEASALANKVGIIAKRMLAVGTTESLSARYSTYEVHFACHTRDEIAKAQILMAKIPGSKMADDVATRLEVSITADFSLSRLFGVLSSSADFSDYTVEKATLESVFLKIIRENHVSELEGRMNAAV